MNHVTIPNKFLIPLFDEFLEELQGPTIFSEFDLKSGYHQIYMKELDIPKMSFQTHQAHYEFKVISIRLMNALVTFQVIMNQIFQHIMRKYALVFLMIS